MASNVTYPRPLPPPPPVTAGRAAQHVDREELLILQQVEATRRRIATVELTWRILVLVTGTVLFAIIAAILDQWVFPKGLPPLFRWSLWATFITAASVWTVVSIVPYLVRRIHPVFAAYVVEQAVPNLKHSLISFLTLRNAREEFQSDPIRKNVFRGLEATTANTIAKVPADAVVDRSQIIRTGYVLIALTAIFCLYVIFSPKDPFRSFARALLPWSRISPPTRVKIDDVRPGTSGIFEGERVVVTANVRGLKAGEEVKLVYSTSDKQAINQAIPMVRERENDDRFSCELSQSFQQETTYRILAGDATTEEYRLTVVIPVRIRIRTVEYQFPRYTGLAPRVTKNLGDIRAIEGTQINMTVESDVPLSTAEMVIEKLQTVSVPMAVKGREAFARTTLRLSKPEASEPEFAAYFIRGQSADGRPSVDPVKYTIEIIPDRPPEGSWLEPKEEEVNLPVNGALPLRIRAVDPDFGLRHVTLEIEAASSPVAKEGLLEKPSGESHSGEFQGEYLFSPKKLNLAVGDVAICRVTLVDNREPTPNRTVLPVRRIRIVAEDAAGQSSDRQPMSQPQQSRNQPSQKTPDAEKNQQRPPENPAQSQFPDEKTSTANEPQSTEGPQQPREPQEQSSRPAEHPAATQDRQEGASRPTPPTENPSETGEPQKNTGAEANNPQKSDPTSGSSSPQTGDQGQMGDQSSSQQGKQQTGTQSPTESSQGRETGQQSETPSGQGTSADRQGDSASTPAAQQGTETGRESAGEPAKSGAGQQTDAREATSQPSADPDNRTTPSEKPGEGQQPATGSRDTHTPRPDGQGQTGQSEASPDRSANQGEKAGGQQQGIPTSPQTGTGSDSTASGRPQPNQGQGSGDNSAGSGERTGGDQTSGSPGVSGSPSPSEPRTTSPGTRQEQTPEQKGTPPGEKVDGISNPGEAVERILSYLEKKGIDPSQLTREAKAGESEQASPREVQKGPTQGEKSRTPSPTDAAGGASSPQPTPEQGGQARPGASPDMPSGVPQLTENPPASGRQDEPAAPPPMGAPPGESGSPDRDPAGQGSQEPPAAGQPDSSARQNPHQPPQGVAGDQAGMGGQGGGRQSPQPGEGTPGSQTPTDSQEGAPMASSEGQETGQAGAKSGASAQSNTTGQGEGGPSQEGQTSQSPGTTGPADQGSRGTPSQMAGGPPSRGGMPGGTRGPGGGTPPVETPVDDPNLEFARRQTDLVLRYLEEELAKQNPDKELLGQLGWSREDAAEFLRRWKELKQAAGDPSPKGKMAQKQLNEIFKSLGLKPRSSTIQGSRQHQDELRGMDAGRDVPPPPQWSEYFEAYLKSLGATP
ncbi:MAG: hypothetical protein WBH86_07925 [Thermogutta sp.]